jgi:hypothetical protein
MKRIVIELPSGYDDILSVTAIGRDKGNVVNVSTCAFDLEKGTHILWEDGKWQQKEALEKMGGK